MVKENDEMIAEMTVEIDKITEGEKTTQVADREHWGCSFPATTKDLMGLELIDKREPDEIH